MIPIYLKRVVVLSALMGTCFTAGVFADDGLKKIEAYLRPDFNISLDGKAIVSEDPTSMIPLIYKDSSYLPLRALADLLKVDINWREETKSILITSRKPVEITDDKDLVYEEITLDFPNRGYLATYGGVKYPVFTTTHNGFMYYRLADIQRIGIDTRGLRKASEKYTKALYVREDELDKVYKLKPQLVISNDPIITTEKDPKKVEALKDFLKNIPLLARTGSSSGILGRNNALVFTVDTMLAPFVDEYEFLCFENGHYVTYQVKFVQDANGRWYQSSFNRNNIEATN
jgi:hypothetical protein